MCVSKFKMRGDLTEVLIKEVCVCGGVDACVVQARAEGRMTSSRPIC